MSVSKTTYKLNYFNARGLVENIRYLFALSHTEYTDFRYPLTVIDMSQFLMEKPEFDRDRDEGKLLKSLNKLPFLQVDGNNGTHIICQSKSIERYLATEFGFMGEDNLEKAQIDSICECVRDLKEMYKSLKRDINKDEKIKEWFSITLPEKLGLLENILGDNFGFSVGNKTSLADITLYTFIYEFFDNKQSAFNACLNNTKILRIVEKINILPEIIDWRETRPDTMF